MLSSKLGPSSESAKRCKVQLAQRLAEGGGDGLAQRLRGAAGEDFNVGFHEGVGYALIGRSKGCAGRLQPAVRSQLSPLKRQAKAYLTPNETRKAPTSFREKAASALAKRVERCRCCPTRARTWTFLNQNQACCQLHHRTGSRRAAALRGCKGTTSGMRGKGRGRNFLAAVGFSLPPSAFAA